eukprot:303874_1
MLRECDYSQALLEQVNQAISDKTPLVIQGSNSKAFLGRPVTGQTLDVRCHRGIVNYDPTELVITARAGTPLVAIEAALESAGQMLPCEPPHYGEEATWGGMVACGLAGPRRPWSGSVRDFVLGTRIITGAGKHLRFGGEVMKNVAGYDLPETAVGVSSDVVMLNDNLQPEEPKTASIPINSNLIVHVGNKVRIDAFGLKSRLTGGKQ